ncbi:MAG TPA: response regulator, partial [Burkholderiaceae bacterium]|nr:response regulator [Burkholderiaceae bacterium]
MRARALIAEDEPLLLQGLRAELQRQWPDLQIIAAVGDGDSALSEALQQRPDVCLLDIRMPGLSGLEVAQALAEDWPAGEPFPLLVFITAYDQYALQAFDAQAVDYLVKPLQPERLAACVQRLRTRLAERVRADELPQTLQQLRTLLAAAGAAA